MVNKLHMKRPSKLLIMREMQMQTTMRYDLTPIRTATIKKKKKEREITSVDKDVKKLKSFSSTGENVKWHSHCGKQYGSSSKP